MRHNDGERKGKKEKNESGSKNGSDGKICQNLLIKNV